MRAFAIMAVLWTTQAAATDIDERVDTARRAYRLCAMTFAQKYAKTKETPPDIVAASLGQCAVQRSEVIIATAQLIASGSADAPASAYKAADDLDGRLQRELTAAIFGDCILDVGKVEAFAP